MCLEITWSHFILIDIWAILEHCTLLDLDLIHIMLIQPPFRLFSKKQLLSSDKKCIFVGSSAAVYHGSTKILCSVQNDQTSEACSKVLQDLNSCTRHAASLVWSFCTLHRIFVLSRYLAPDEPTNIFLARKSTNHPKVPISSSTSRAPRIRKVRYVGF